MLKVEHLPVIPMRRGKKPGKFFKLTKDKEIEFKKDEVVHLIKPDLKQDIYSVPEYLGSMQPELSGIMPDNTDGFGDIEKIMRVYYELEVLPLQQAFLDINEAVGIEIIKFRKPDSTNETQSVG